MPATIIEERKPAIKIIMLDLWCVVPYYTGYLCKALNDEGIDVILASVSYRYDPHHFEKLGLQVKPGLLDFVAKCGIGSVSLRQGLKLIECFVNFVALAVRVATSKPDFIHVQFIPLVKKKIPFEHWFLAFVKWRNCKLCYTVHNELPMDTGELHLKTFKNIYSTMDLLICHTSDSQRRLIDRFGVPPERIRVVPHGPLFSETERCTGIEARLRLELNADRPVVLWQGWVKPYKGVPQLLAAWQEVHRHRPEALLIVAGSGDDQLLSEIRNTVKELDLTDSVQLELRFMPVEEMTLYYHAADVVVYPYKEITTSGALMTGLTHGKAIIATALPGFQEVLQHGKCALLIPPGDVDALAEAIRHLIDNPEVRLRLAREAAKIAAARQTSWSSIARTTADIYRSLVKTHDLHHYSSL